MGRSIRIHLLAMAIITLGLLLLSNLVIAPMILKNREKLEISLNYSVRLYANQSLMYFDTLRSGDSFYRQGINFTGQTFTQYVPKLARTNLIMETQWEVDTTPILSLKTAVIFTASASYVALVYSSEKSIDISGPNPVEVNASAILLIFSAHDGELIQNVTYTRSSAAIPDRDEQILDWKFYDRLITENTLYQPVIFYDTATAALEHAMVKWYHHLSHCPSSRQLQILHK